ncbi:MULTISPECIES: nucleoside-diphosphate sugar epimerase/dehydratase [unclassified Halomonas]|uniref:polysaccharide biosynthesis protein n=1 Tax=unclassified Halomonas TaxID=2609666 RepID=UPI002076AC55|nr:MULTISPECIES: nucleoside-diphosphate sugar epimerase/dehydratase [unclassified Halomonas]
MLSRLLHPLFRLPRPQKRLIQLVVDAGLITVSFLLAMFLRLDGWSFVSNSNVWLVLPAIIPISLFIFARLGFYRAIIRFMDMQAATTVLAGVLASTMVLIVVNYVALLPIPRSVPFIYAMLAMLTIGGVRAVLRSLYTRGQVRYKTRVLIYGAGSSGRQLVVSFRNGNEYEPVCFIDDDADVQRSSIQGLKVHHPRAVQGLIDVYGVEKILLAMPSASRARRREILESLEGITVPVQTVPGMADVITGRAKTTEIRDVAVEDLLGRDPVPPDASLIGANITDKVVLVTGAGGSIGSELCRQILRQQPSKLLLLEISEYNLYCVEQDLRTLAQAEGLDHVEVMALLGSVQHTERLQSVMTYYQVQTVYHAAAYKHVPMVEHNVEEGLVNNAIGTLNCARAAVESGVSDFVLVSTDKAVRPTNVMGATKRLAELVCQAMSNAQKGTRFCMVRFGNVLGSSGSVVPMFRRQIAAGGPVTVTHPEITRYFMTIPEAAQLVIQAGAMAKGGDVFVLDMGEPIKITDLATKMVRLSGFDPYVNQPNQSGHSIKGDIEIRFTGLRPGEKLYEELLIGERVRHTSHSRIMTAHEVSLTLQETERLMEELVRACQQSDSRRLQQLLIDAPLGYAPNSELVDHLWQCPERKEAVLTARHGDFDSSPALHSAA